MKRITRPFYSLLLSMLAVSVAIFSSCGKLDDVEPESEFYVKFKPNGITEVFDEDVFAQRGP